jgi:hypothetical protein
MTSTAKNKAGPLAEEEGVQTALRVAAGHGVRGVGVNNSVSRR